MQLLQWSLNESELHSQLRMKSILDEALNR